MTKRRTKEEIERGLPPIASTQEPDYSYLKRGDPKRRPFFPKNLYVRWVTIAAMVFFLLCIGVTSHKLYKSNQRWNQETQELLEHLRDNNERREQEFEKEMRDHEDKYGY